MRAPPAWWAEDGVNPVHPVEPRQRRANLRMALVLASVAVVFALGFFVRVVWFGR